MRVAEITTAKIKEYVDKKMTGGLSNASINRELAALKRIFHLAAQGTTSEGRTGSIYPYAERNKRSERIL
jgi:site-specific recombinase XerD